MILGNPDVAVSVNLGVLSVTVLLIRASLFGVATRSPEFLETPTWPKLRPT